MAKVAILGFGVVGSGVAEVLRRNSAHINEKVHSSVELKYILDVKDLLDSPFRDLVVHDFSVIEQDPEVDVVVETIGGIRAAKEFTERALRAGKSVVTSNKELVAHYGYELMRLAQEHDVSYLYEASVGGGIPIIRPLKQCLAANEITEICGILNGTTNYILTRMIRGGLPFSEALEEAQAKGYAEADPTADVEGLDACRKICILASLAFGKHVYPSQVPAEGITGVTLADVAYAASCGYRIKLLGRTLRDEEGKVRAYVAPHLIPEEAPLAGVEDVFNAITVRGNAIGDVMFYGRGAGKLPTASAVVADVMDAIGRKDRPKYTDWGPGDPNAVGSPEGLPSRWYVRFREKDGQALSQRVDVGRILARQDAPVGEKAILTLQAMTRTELDRAMAGLEILSAFRVQAE